MKYQCSLVGSSLLVTIFTMGISLAAPKTGESKSSLLQLYGRRLDNHENRITDLENQTNTLPEQVRPGNAAPKIGILAYSVKRGDTFIGISERTGVSVSELMRINNIKNERDLRAGQQLIIPGKPAQGVQGPQGTATPREAPAGRQAVSSYTVRSGDNITKIANRLKTTPAALAKANGFSSIHQTIRIGQVLRVPGSQSRTKDGGSTASRSGKTARENYKITGRETFYSLSRTYKVSVEDLTAANPGVNPNALREGMIIVIPVRNGRMQDTIPSKSEISQQPPPEDAQSLHNAARKSSPVAKEVNYQPMEKTNTTSDLLSTPTGQDPTFQYDVGPGDTWDSVAREFLTTVPKLKATNPSKAAGELKPNDSIFVPRERIRNGTRQSPGMG